MPNLARKVLNPAHPLHSDIASAVSASQLKISFADLISGDEIGVQQAVLTFSFEESFTTSWGARQGVARNDTHWFEINTLNLRKRNLDGSLAASNDTPFDGLPAGLNHCGDSHVDEQFLYVPISQWQSAPQTSPVTVIAWYNVSDLSLAGYFDISADVEPEMNGSGLCLSPDGSEFWVTSFRSTETPEPYTTKIWRFRKSDGLHLGEHELSDPVLEMQGITWNPDTKGVYISSWRLAGVGRRPRIFIFDENFQLQQITRPTGIGSDTSTTEIEGIHYYGGHVYFHVIDNAPRKVFGNTAIVRAESRSNVPLIYNGSSEQGTILIRCKLHTQPPGAVNTIFDNLDDPNHWEAFHRTDGSIRWRVNSSGPNCEITNVNASQEQRVLSFSWERQGGDVQAKLGINGAWGDTRTQGWIAPPASGVFLGASNSENPQTDAQFQDIVVFDKALSDAELASVYADFDSLYVAESQPLNPPQGTVTIDSVSVDDDEATVSYSYNDTDEDGFEYRLNGGSATVVAENPFTLSALAAGSYIVEVRAFNADGAGDWSSPAGFDIVEPQRELILNVQGIPNGTYDVRLFNSAAGTFIETASLTFANGGATYSTELATGTVIEGYILDGNEPPENGAIIYGTVTDA